MLTDQHRAFLATHRTAAMVTVGRDGFPKPARVGVALLGDRLLSSATESRVRTRRLRRDPRCTLFVFDAAASWLGIEATVRILDGEDAHHQTVELFRVMQGRPAGPLSWFGQDLDEEAFLRVLADEGRVLYEFEVARVYGLLA
jgi:PPOX class probable F420-dependent enzyme